MRIQTIWIRQNRTFMIFQRCRHEIIFPNWSSAHPRWWYFQKRRIRRREKSQNTSFRRQEIQQPFQHPVNKGLPWIRILYLNEIRTSEHILFSILVLVSSSKIDEFEWLKTSTGRKFAFQNSVPSVLILLTMKRRVRKRDVLYFLLFYFRNVLLKHRDC